ncbi:hypothetical protein [Rubellimicrobium roseum]|uniref:Secreted protein n=1 Tax=Rubellimicrobium roseum TaxID=687525 RepID=A0A5C4NLW6_9RHOB|nr:hypothetical protein [Rubellimicrobium roseum]TNC74875.1 hypothetical protein FHG71_01715 [Rubellimicrobium roseum]
MRRLPLVLLALWPACALAGPDLTYGIALDSEQGAAELHLSRCEAGCFAQVAYVNRYLQGGAWTREFTLDLNGFAVMVTIVDGDGQKPEMVRVTPPPGYTADPAELPVEEGTTGVVAIHALGMS